MSNYSIKRDYIPFGQSRSGRKIAKVRFIVAHDTGNSGSSAQGNVNWFKGNPIEASAHTFIDDKEIIENVPLSEKAWHVRYNVSKDNQLFGANANDAAIGVELCYGGSIDFREAYKRYVWYLAYLCKKYSLNPKKHIVGHSKLDPSRKTDPENALHRYGLTFDELIMDVYNEYLGDPLEKGWLQEGDTGESVGDLQRLLNQIGYNLTVDNSYGPKTAQAVANFQKNHSLNPDETYGPNTQKALEQALERYASVANKKEEDDQMARDINKVSDWAKDDWEEVTENGYFDGKRPGATITREESGIVVNRIRHNFLELIDKNKDEIERLHKALESVGAEIPEE